MPTREPPPTPTKALTDHLVERGVALGLAAVGVTPAELFDRTLADLRERKAAGLHATMYFTYGRPDRSCDPRGGLPDATSLVVGALRYDGSAVPKPSAGVPSSIAASARSDHYGRLRRALSALAVELRSQGWRSRVLADDNALVDREAARRAGLGAYGRNANLLLAGAGSWYVLGSILTDAPLVARPWAGEQPVAEPRCGTCRRCIDACPTGAIVADGVVDARRCLAWLVEAGGVFPAEHRVALGDRLYGCDECQTVCPLNVADDRHHAPEPDAEPWVDALWVLDATDHQLMSRFARFYLAGRDPSILRRNAVLVLANSAEPTDAVIGVLGGCLAGEDPLVAAHAVWALRRLGRPDVVESHLAAGRRHGQSPEFVAELERAVDAR